MFGWNYFNKFIVDVYSNRVVSLHESLSSSVMNLLCDFGCDFSGLIFLGDVQVEEPEDDAE